MAEAITEMIIPGTYIEVRSEGLIGVSGIATGNVGVVGTAAKGPVGQAIIVSSFSETKDIFGDYDAWVDGASGELTLVRALQQVFANGGSTVYAVRTASSGVDTGVRPLADDIGTVVTFKAKSPGTWSVRSRYRFWPPQPTGSSKRTSKSSLLPPSAICINISPTPPTTRSR